MLLKGSVIKLCDLGMSSLLCNGIEPTKSKTHLYKPFAEETVTEKTGVFSLGILIIQILTKKMPIISVGSYEVERRSYHLKIIEDECIFFLIAVECLGDEPNKRPNIHMIYDFLYRKIIITEPYIHSKKKSSQ